jgi:hypothetical protein
MAKLVENRTSFGLYPEMVAYPRFCNKCSQPIMMSELASGNWQPWDQDGSRHVCSTRRTTGHNGNLSDAFPTESGTETYLTRCPWCRDHVYYHTNGNGDTVYFDSLGWPWQVHPCWQQHWGTQKKRQRLLKRLRNLNNQMQQQRLMLLGILKKNAGVLQKGTASFPIKETTLAKWMGLTLKQLRHTYGHLYLASQNSITIVDVPKSDKLRVIVLNPPEQSSNPNSPVVRVTRDGFERVQCPHCQEWKIADRIEVHLVACREKRYRKGRYGKLSQQAGGNRHILRLNQPTRQQKRQRPEKRERDLLKALQAEAVKESNCQLDQFR